MTATLRKCSINQDDEEEECQLLTEVCLKPILLSLPDPTNPKSDYERLYEEHQRTLEALQHLTEGVRIVTRQLRLFHQQLLWEEDVSLGACEDDASSFATRTVSSGTVSLQDERLQTLEQALAGSRESDVLGGLVWAAQSVQASWSGRQTEDWIPAQQHTAAEQTHETLLRDNSRLAQELAQAKFERRVLKKEVKALRQETEALRQSDRMTALEQHVRGALMIHEEQLARATRKNTTKPQELFTIQQDEATKLVFSTMGSMVQLPLVHTPTTFEPQLSLLETPSTERSTDDSSNKENHSALRILTGLFRNESIPPFIKIGAVLAPEDSPVSASHHVECDESVPRCLALPMTVDETPTKH
jgi:hypothetical protein